MHLDKIIKLLPGFLAQNIAIEIRGNSGIGKTEMIRQMVHDLNKSDPSWGIGTHYAAMWGPQDPPGFFVFGKHEIMQPDGTMKDQLVSEFATPTWLRADPGQEYEWMNQYKRGVVVLEEFDKTNPEVKKSCAPLILDGGMHGNFLHKGIGRILLTNHAAEGRQGSTREFDFTITRRIVLNAVQTSEKWGDWAEAYGLHPIFIAFAMEHVNTVFGNILPEKIGPMCNPRTLVACAKAAGAGLIDLDGHVLDEEALQEVSAGAMGGPATRDLMTFLKFKDEVPDWKDIIAKPDTAKIPGNPGGQMMVAHICATNVDDKTCEPAVKYVRRLAKSIHIVFAKAATRRNFRLVNSKPFVKWTQEAPELVALMTALGGAR